VTHMRYRGGPKSRRRDRIRGSQIRRVSVWESMVDSAEPRKAPEDGRATVCDSQYGESKSIINENAIQTPWEMVMSKFPLCISPTGYFLSNSKETHGHSWEDWGISSDVNRFDRLSNLMWSELTDQIERFHGISSESIEWSHLISSHSNWIDWPDWAISSHSYEQIEWSFLIESEHIDHIEWSHLMRTDWRNWVISSNHND
jgi:hypothetical protein